MKRSEKWVKVMANLFHASDAGWMSIDEGMNDGENDFVLIADAFGPECRSYGHVYYDRIEFYALDDEDLHYRKMTIATDTWDFIPAPHAVNRFICA